MSEAALKKVNKEITRLENDFETHEQSLPMSEACKKIVDFVDAEDEPFSQTFAQSNPYAVDTGGICACSIM